MRWYPTPPWPLEEREAAKRRLRAVAAASRALAIEAAHAIAEVKRTGAHWREGAASIREFAERQGMSSTDAYRYERVAQAFESFPKTLELLASGRLTVGAAAVLGDLARLPAEARIDADAWLDHAEKDDARTLRRRFEKRRDEHRVGKPVCTLVANVDQQTLDDAYRARVLLSRPLHQVLTIGQMLGLVLGEWVRRNDPLLVKPGTRRAPDTNTRPFDRYVPKAVDRAVRIRSDDKCIVPFCLSTFWVERAHLVPHRDGSGRETGDLHVLCDFHNFLHETGDIRIGGTPENPVVTDREGVVLGTRFRPEVGCDGPSASAFARGLGDEIGGQRAPSEFEDPDEMRDLREEEAEAAAHVAEDPSPPTPT